jgi:hypothetical protein
VDGGTSDGIYAQIERKEDIIKPENSPTHCLDASQASQESQTEDARTQPDEESKLRDLPEELEDDLDTVSEEEWMQEQSKKSFIHNPIIPIQDFFSNNIPLPGHSIEESPCYDIIGSRPGEISTDTIYYCKLHPELGSIFLTEIELHCIQKEPDIHKSEILRLESQKQRGESA